MQISLKDLKKVIKEEVANLSYDIEDSPEDPIDGESPDEIEPVEQAFAGGRNISNQVDHVAIGGEESNTRGLEMLTISELRKMIQKDVLLEMNPDGTISDDEDNERDLLMAEVEEQVEELIMFIQMEAQRIGGGFRGPGIKRQAYKLVAQMLREAR